MVGRLHGAIDNPTGRNSESVAVAGAHKVEGTTLSDFLQHAIIEPSRSAPLATLAVIVVAVAAICLQSAQALAQAVGRSVTVQVDNDYFANSDRHYTNGLRLAYVPPQNGKSLPVPAAAAASVGERIARRLRIDPLFRSRRQSEPFYAFALGQSMFTPSDIGRVDPDPRDRPYAGWAYATVSLHALNEDKSALGSFELNVGIVGPSARAGEAQVWWHERNGFRTPTGWDHQLRDEPAIVLSYDRKWRWRSNLDSTVPPPGLAYEFITGVGGAFGNVYDYVSIGGLVRVGHNIPLDFGPPRIRPSISGFDAFVAGTPGAAKVLRGYLFAGGGIRGVARDIFLDGNTFAAGPRVDKVPVVFEAQAGVSVTLFERLRMTYQGTYRTPEFHGQDEPDQFAGVSLTWRMLF